MPSREINPIWRWLIFAVVVAAGSGLAVSGARHALSAHWAGSADPDLMLRAAENEPSNPDLWYRLARYRQLDLEHSDLPLAISYYRRAISMDSISPFYWMDLASAYESAGDPLKAEEAFREARELYPISADAAWRLGNFLLRQDRVPEAFQQIHEAVAIEPKLTMPAISLCWRGTQDIDRILSTVLPDEPEENWGAIQFFVQAGAPLPAMAAWKRLAADHVSFPVSNAFPLLDMLIAAGRADDAHAVWNQALMAAGFRQKEKSTSSVVWNGSFEEEPLDGGFDWRFRTVDGALMRWDEQSVHSGERSLRVDFDGSTNVDFENVWQYVAVSPATAYRFSAFFRTEELSTDSGVRFEIRDVSRPGTPALSSGNLVGTQNWTAENLELRTGPETRLLQIVLRRTRGDKFDNKIRGTVWVDDVALLPESRASGAAR